MGSLHLMDCEDSARRAARCQELLLIPREHAAALGRSAVEAARLGRYRDAAGRTVEWGDLVDRARTGAKTIPADAALSAAGPARWSHTRVQVTNDTTLSAARRLTNERVEGGVLVLNMANGVQPGGGFLGGARAQEESLCRVSALHATLEGDPMYAAHAERLLPDSTAWAILSPEVPVFRDEEGQPLPRPWTVGVVTCAAPVAQVVGQPTSGDLLAARIRRVLDIARAHGYGALVLGAWGCGAFGNDPDRTARDFRNALTDMAGSFADVVFAVADWSPERRFLGPFRDVFSP